MIVPHENHLKTKPTTKEYDKGWDHIFKKKKRQKKKKSLRKSKARFSHGSFSELADFA